MVLEAEAATAYCDLAARLLEVARPGTQFPDPAGLRHLLWGLGQPWPRQPRPRAEVFVASGLPTVRALERLEALRKTAVDFLASHGAKPSPGSPAPLTALAAVALPRREATVARLVSKARGGRRFQVVHERYAGPLGLPTRFSFHLTDQKERYLSPAGDGTAKVARALASALELSCEAGAEEALWGLSSLEGAEVFEVVMGQVGPLQAPGLVPAFDAHPLAAFLAGRPAGTAGETGALHLVLERAAADVAQDRCRDPFHALPQGGQHERRRQGLGYRLARERRLACTPALEPALVAHLASLGQPLVVRSR